MAATHQPGHFRGLTVRNVRPQMLLMPNTLGVRLVSVDGDHGFEFERTVGARRHAPIGRRLYSRTNGPWTLGRTHRLAIKAVADTVEAVVFDANGRELFAEAWLVVGAAPPTLGTPSVYSFGGLKVRFGDLECDSAE